MVDCGISDDEHGNFVVRGCIGSETGGRTWMLERRRDCEALLCKSERSNHDDSASQVCCLDHVQPIKDSACSADTE